MPARQRPPSAARELIPEQPDLDALRQAAAGCTACDLYRDATQTVFGEGSPDAGVMLVGEQPGDGEDKAGRPFVGPAGRLLDRALEEAGIDRELAYVTNVVKHFKFERRGKVRLHKKPNAEEVYACLPWLEAELAVVRPRVLVVLGATAAQALLGSSFRVSRQRGEFVDADLAPRVLATVHPSSILRAPDDEARALAYKGFVADLTVVAAELGRDAGGR
jgi:uracil-DNA glycosylase family protein